MRAVALKAAVFAAAGAFMLAGCGDDSSSPKPVTGLSLSPTDMEVELGHPREITPTVNGDNKNLTWYVNGIENGNQLLGEITENSPATYTAPDFLPDPPTVLIKAVSVEDTTIHATCSVTITFDKLFVDADDGNDADYGSINLPFKTITHAMSEADSGTTVVVQPGVYDHDNGETFPINVGGGEDITLVGMNWETCIIRGHATLGYESCVSVGGDGCSFRKFTVEPGPPEEPQCNVAVYVTGDGSVVDSVRTSYRAGYSFLRLDNTVGATLSNNYFVVADGIHQNRGYEIVFDNSGTAITNCTVSGYFAGLFFNNDEDARVEGCVLEDNHYGVELCCFESATSNPNPDLGGGARGSTGGNIIRNNIGCGLLNPTYNVIFARFNTWSNSPPVAGEDYCNTSTGGVIVQ